ncbi:MAG: hypothetical protein JWO20_2982, partial [Candidatus Angelobacter sp.]|nr:hypothetical protein [Candidatus Angelobacter sp.]
LADGVDGGGERTLFVHAGKGLLHCLRHVHGDGSVESAAVFKCDEAVEDVVIGARGGWMKRPLEFEVQGDAADADVV